MIFNISIFPPACRGDHTEVIDIEYDPELVSYTHLLSLFWNNHEYSLTKKIKRQVCRWCMLIMFDYVSFSVKE